jgi:putative membrane protein
MKIGPLGKKNNGRGILSELLLPGGIEPDPRFTLANERTFLAWMRTSLALMAGGIALASLTSQAADRAMLTDAAVLLLGIAILTSLSGCIRWIRVERAMRNNASLPFPVAVPALTAVILVLVIAAIARVF